MPLRPQRIAIIGAGISGLVAAKVLKQHGLSVSVFEKGSALGGIWRFNNDNGASTCYRSLHINTSKRMMQLSDFPFKEEMAEYPPHWQILEEFERYAEQFQLLPLIQFNTEVRHCAPMPEGGWQLTLHCAEGEQTQDFDFLVVANGHHWSPRLPEFSGQFDGELIHAHHYVDVTEPLDLRDKTVVVVGSGNSAMDIACELGRTGQGAKKVLLSQRSGVWVLPKLFGNLAQDKFVRHPMKPPSLWERLVRETLPRRFRLAVRDRVHQGLISLLAGSPQRMGMKPPKGRLSQHHPTVSQEIYHRLTHGDVLARGEITQLNGHTVTFEDGQQEQVDAIICATGYDIRFPFFDQPELTPQGNRFPLWHRIFPPQRQDLAFIGLIQPVCALMPIAELQSEFLADVLIGEVALPDGAKLAKETAAQDAEAAEGYLPSPSHTIQADCPEYSYNLRKAWQLGRKRASSTAQTPS
ncbi:flavin-containing monooxygenase [Ferrimonas marina]|uniref:Predicted flavoprotein CzcO associated with the cation diffusion facilitator CzcD n=1 Tax=Ferrimonas marina TaxID=299255 RepID=A0A1M5YW14_9GAMM|nr:NAD(P)-binding domain-containing protein [Ferrimonas marina]SHI16020.1 Predicted flavoprotein CzcO associated with the cation diffusion facilitator CzcD [Ferrimonas marina]